MPMGSCHDSACSLECRLPVTTIAAHQNAVAPLSDRLELWTATQRVTVHPSVLSIVPDPRSVSPSVSQSLGGHGSCVVSEPTTAVISGLDVKMSCTMNADVRREAVTAPAASTASAAASTPMSAAFCRWVGRCRVHECR